MRSSRTWAIARKEFLHIYRDWRSLGLVILMPALLMLLFGYAISIDDQRLVATLHYRPDRLQRLSSISQARAYEDRIHVLD